MGAITSKMPTLVHHRPLKTHMGNSHVRLFCSFRRLTWHKSFFFYPNALYTIASAFPKEKWLNIIATFQNQNISWPRTMHSPESTESEWAGTCCFSCCIGKPSPPKRADLCETDPKGQTAGTPAATCRGRILLVLRFWFFGLSDQGFADSGRP